MKHSLVLLFLVSTFAHAQQTLNEDGSVSPTQTTLNVTPTATTDQPTTQKPTGEQKIPAWGTMTEFGTIRFANSDAMDLSPKPQKKNCYRRKYVVFGPIIDTCASDAVEPADPDSIVSGDDVLKFMIKIDKDAMRSDASGSRDLVARSEALAILEKVIAREALAGALPKEVDSLRVEYFVTAVLTQNAVKHGLIPTKLNEPCKILIDIDLNNLSSKQELDDLLAAITANSIQYEILDASTNGTIGLGSLTKILRMDITKASSSNVDAIHAYLNTKKIKNSEHNGNNCKLVVDTDVTKLSRAQLLPLYEGLKTALKGQGMITLSSQWTYRAGNLGFWLDTFLSTDKLKWPKFAMSLAELPDTLDGFETAVRNSMQEWHTALRNKAAWGRVVSVYTPNNLRGQSDAPTSTEVDRMYAEVKDSVLDELKANGDPNPKFDLKNPDGSYIQPSPEALEREAQGGPKHAPTVQEMIINKIMDVRQTLVAREAMAELFRKNPFVVSSFDTCSDDRYACAAPLKAEDLANSLFFETLYKGERLSPTPITGAQPATSLGHPSDFYKVLDLNSDLLGLVLR